MRNQNKNFNDCKNCIYFYGHGYCDSSIDSCEKCPQYNKESDDVHCRCLEKNNLNKCPYYKEYEITKTSVTDLLRKDFKNGRNN